MNESSGWMRSRRLAGGFTEGQLFVAVYCGRNLGTKFSEQWRNKLMQKNGMSTYVHMHAFPYIQQLPPLVICAVFSCWAAAHGSFLFLKLLLHCKNQCPKSLIFLPFSSIFSLSYQISIFQHQTKPAMEIRASSFDGHYFPAWFPFLRCFILKQSPSCWYDQGLPKGWNQVSFLFILVQPSVTWSFIGNKLVLLEENVTLGLNRRGKILLLVLKTILFLVS